MVNKTKCIQIDVGWMDKDICFVYKDGDTAYGYKQFKPFYFNKANKIKWSVLKSLYPSLSTIFIRRIKKIPKQLNGYKYSPSILIDDALLLDIFEYLTKTNNEYKGIAIQYPLNSKDSLNQIIKEHSISFNKINFKMVLKTQNSSQCGSCPSFQILRSV